MRYIIAIGSLLVIAVLCGSYALVARQQDVAKAGVWLITHQFDDSASNDSQTVTFVVNKGETAASVAERLYQKKLITSEFVFSTLARLRGVDAHLEAGEYQLRRNMTMNEVLDELQRNRFAGSRITIPEGWRAEEIANLIEQRGLAQRETFLALVRNGNFDADFLRARPTGASLEGYLFPDTYLIPPNATADQVITLMLKNFGQQLNPAMREQAASSGLSIHEIITLASIVEREAVIPAERPIIASVYLNRLKADMLLQADPTVQFAAANAASSDASAGNAPHDYWKNSLTQADLQINSPYNTYRYKGLPPGPIANPGLASIKAVLEPAKTDYYYFVASENGAHAFAKTLEEHLDNVVKYRK